MKFRFLEDHDCYDGSQLRSLFGYLEHGVLGDSMIAWVGPCNVSFDHMVDGEDLLQQNTIESKSMLHFVCEIFDRDLYTGVFLQRLMTTHLADLMRTEADILDVDIRVLRKGDDLYIDERKLNVSIATRSPGSVLIHFGINVSNDGTPVPTYSLSDLQMDPQAVAVSLSKRVLGEWEDIKKATHKVKWVK